VTAPRHLQVAAGLRARIADGTLTPGSAAPSGAALARATGYSALTCRKALVLLIMEGALRPGPSPNARPRVAGPDPAGPDLAARAAALSGALARRRRAAGLTQAELAALAGCSVTTIGHAETGRVWQSRRFWETADKALNAAGELLRLHDHHSAALTRPAPAGAAGTAGAVGQALAAAPAPAPPPAPVSVTITWPDGTTTTVRQPPPAPPDRNPR
jgi:DNA-binding XRE family transcriptional regulator